MHHAGEKREKEEGAACCVFSRSHDAGGEGSCSTRRGEGGRGGEGLFFTFSGKGEEIQCLFRIT